MLQYEQITNTIAKHYSPDLTKQTVEAASAPVKTKHKAYDVVPEAMLHSSQIHGGL